MKYQSSITFESTSLSYGAWHLMCDRRTNRWMDGQTDGKRSKWSPSLAMLCRQHKNLWGRQLGITKEIRATHITLVILVVCSYFSAIVLVLRFFNNTIVRRYNLRFSKQAPVSFLFFIAQPRHVWFFFFLLLYKVFPYII